MKVIQHLTNLLLREKSVILPGFGEFSTVDVPAAALSAGNFSPPSKKLTFNSSVKANDYVLAKYIAEMEEIGIAKGNEMIKEFVDECTQKLHDELSLNIPRIGTFSVSGAGAPMLFTADDSENFQVASFGLESFQIASDRKMEIPQPVDQAMPETAALTADSQSIEQKQPPKKEKKKRSGLWIFLIIITLLITAAAAWVILNQEQAENYWNIVKEKITPEKRVTPPAEETPEPETIIPAIEPEQETDNPVVEQEPENMSGQPAKQDPPTTAAPITPSPSSGNTFVIIAGCFGEHSNAEKMVQRLQQLGFQEASLDGKTSSGLVRVAAGYYPTREAATQAMRMAEEQNKLKNAWIGKRQNP